MAPSIRTKNSSMPTIGYGRINPDSFGPHFFPPETGKGFDLFIGARRLEDRRSSNSNRRTRHIYRASNHQGIHRSSPILRFSSDVEGSTLAVVRIDTAQIQV